MAQYDWEIWRDGTFIADISGYATDRKVTVQRNGNGQITFGVDARQLRLFAESNNLTVHGILAEGRNEVRVKRNGTYLRQGGQIGHVSDALSESVHKQSTVTANGFLGLLEDRYLEKKRTFNNVQAATILWTVINEMQTGSANFWAAPTPSGARATYGITQGSLDTTIGTKVRTYEPGKNVRDILVQMTQLITTDTDVEITYDKTLNVYERMGTDKPQVVFEYGRNILDYEIPRDATGLVNRAVTYGQGAGADVIVQSIDQDTDSQDLYQVRQHVIQMNSVSEEDTLSEHGAGRVAVSKNPLVIPRLTVDLQRDFTIADFWVGDAVTVRISDPDIPVEVDGLFRIEQIDLDIADNGTEKANLMVSSWA